MLDPAQTAAAATETSRASAVFVLAVSVSAALIFSFLCSIFESVLLSVSRGHVEAMAKGGSRAGRILRRWKRTDIEVPIAAILILNTLAHTVGATVAGSSYEAALGGDTLWVFSLAFTLAVLFFTEIIPKTLGVTFAQRLAAPVTLAVSALTIVLKPILWGTTALSRMLTKNHERPVTSVEEIRLLAALGSREGQVGPRFAQLIEGAASLRELTVYDVMVPRGGVAFLSSAKSLEENLVIIRETGHSRFPLTPSDALDDVEAIVLAKELWFHVHDTGADQDVDWAQLKSPLLVFPETKRLDEALRLFQTKRQHLAVVVDEYGGTQGVVTMEDVLEEIVGEIEDETDRVEQLIEQRVEDGAYVCKGRAETRKVFKVLGIQGDRQDSVTIGGYIANRLGRVPVVGDEIAIEHVKIRVVRASSRRVERIEITQLGKAAQSDT